MAEESVRTRQLQQIPVFALREVIHELLIDPDTKGTMRARFQTALNQDPRSLRRAVQRLNREQLTSLINVCPEITDGWIHELFEEYRYGSNPSFYIYLFDSRSLDPARLAGLRSGIREEMSAFNEGQQEALPRLRGLTLNDLGPLPGRPQIIEGTYRFSKRLDYIDEAENAVSIYETLYGFFWFHTARGYAIIQARDRSVLHALRRGIEAGAGVHLTTLVISKKLKNALPFLMRGAFRSGRLHDPDPTPDRFEWMTLTDDDPYSKGYEQWEDRYPELRSARYRDWVDEEKETSLTIRCDRGALSLAGKLMASQFRAWCLDRLGQIVDVLETFQEDPAIYVHTHGLKSVPEMARFRLDQREVIATLIAHLLTLKRAPDLGYRATGLSPLEIAATLGRYVQVQIPHECGEPECVEPAYLGCPDCQGKRMFLIAEEGDLYLECVQHRRRRWRGSPPLEGECERGHPFSLEPPLIEEAMEIIPGEDLVRALSQVVDRYLPGYRFNPSKESFILRGPNLLYFDERAMVRFREEQAARTIIYLRQEAETIDKDGTMAGVVVQGDRDSVRVEEGEGSGRGKS
jgi:hypothetical protein